MKSKRVAIYARVSTTGRQEAVNQLTQLREFCRRQGWLVVAEYIDQETGSVSTRADFQKMLLHASQRRFDVLLFWGLDRLTREGTLATLQYLERLTSYHVGYKSFTEPYLDSCGTFKDVVISLLATMAKQERIRMGERVRAGLQHARSQGKKLGRPPLRQLKAAEVAKLRKERTRTNAPFRILAQKYRLSVWTVHRICNKHGQSSLSEDTPESTSAETSIGLHTDGKDSSISSPRIRLILTMPKPYSTGRKRNL
jgi:DNA invertase Pin-like site-specific DNA recombinase